MITDLDRIVESTPLTAKNCRFFLSEYGLLMAEIPEKEFRGRVLLSLAFPFETREEYVAVQNGENEELGMIRRLSDLDENTAALLSDQIRKKYFAPKIQKILLWKERFGTAYVECETDVGKLSFSVRDVIRSIIRLSDDRMFLVDVDGCRYEIESLKALDKKSYSKIELYV